MQVNVSPAKTETTSAELFSFKWQIKNNTNEHSVLLNSLNLYMRGSHTAIDVPPEFKNQMVAGQAAQTLAQMWGCTDKESATKACEILLSPDSFGRVYFDLFLGLTRLYRDKIEQGESDEAVMAELAEFVEQLSKRRPELGTDLKREFVNWMNVYRDPRFQAYAPQIIPETSAGWDIGRVDNVTALAVQAGIMNSAEHQEFANHALARAKENFDDWYDYMLSHWWGRAIWLSTDGETFPQIKGQLLSADEVYTRAFTHKSSPWLRFPLRR